METLKCPLCVKEFYSGVGEGCRMCGMPLEEQDYEFCSDECIIKFEVVNNLR